MAGGMNKRGSWGPMSERTAGPVPGLADTTPQTAGPSPIKHCWVTDCNGTMPGLLLEWREYEGQWRGRVVRPVFEAGEWVAVEQWFDRELLGPT